MASENDIKRIFIQVDDDGSGRIDSDVGQSEADREKSDFNRWIDENAKTINNALPWADYLPSNKDSPNAEAAKEKAIEENEDIPELLAGLGEDLSSIPKLEDILNSINAELQEIAEELKDQTPEGGNQPPPSKADNSLPPVPADASGGGGGGAGAAAAMAMADGPQPGPADLAALALLIGGQLGVGADPSQGDAAAFGVDTGIDILNDLLSILEDIDRHILSIADDIRPYSGEVQLAEMQNELKQMEAMIRREDALGDSVGQFISERGDLNAAITDLVTAVEDIALDELVGLFATANQNIFIPILERFTEYAKRAEAYFEVAKALGRRLGVDLDKLVQLNQRDDTDDLMVDLEQLLQGGGLDHFGGRVGKARKAMADRFPQAAGVYF